MTQRNTNHGASGSPPSDVPEPTLAERARTLVSLGGASSLSTNLQKHIGYPFGSVMPYALDASASPIFLISSMATHTQNLTADRRASLLVQARSDRPDSLGVARATLVGDATCLDDHERREVRDVYLDKNPDASNWIDYPDFRFFRLKVLDVYFIGGFGVMGWLSGSDYYAAVPDPLAEIGPGIIAHMNADHADALVDIVNHSGDYGATSARMTAIDRLGFNVRLETNKGVRGARVAFEREVHDSPTARAVFVHMAQTARNSG
jgi:putative heme iron utilization protein